MANEKYSRVDGRKSSSSSYCLRVSNAAFVALCLAGVWMVVSSSISPGQESGAFQEKKNEVKRHATEISDQNNSGAIDEISKLKSDEGGSNQFEDSPGDLLEFATKGDTNLNTDQEGENDNSEGMEKQEEKSEESEDENKEDKSATESENEEEKKDEVSEVANDSESGETKEDKSDDNDENSNEESGELEEDVETKKDVELDQVSTKENNNSSELLPSGAQSELLNESTTQNGAFSNQAKESKEENDLQTSSLSKNQIDNSWKICNTSAGPDYIPCLDNLAAIRRLPSTMHYEHRERHCPDNAPTCLVPLPAGYKPPIQWPTSREKIWYNNVPHTKLAKIKGHQNWVKVTGDYLTFPGGGTQFKNGALHYIDVIQQSVPEIAWGERSRVVLDVGCGVASFGGFLFERDVLTMSLAPKDEHEAQVQFALERGIPATSAVMGTKRLPYPGRVFDIVHCAHCRVPWHIEGGKLLLELNRVLRPGGFFVWSATPIYQKIPVDVEIWEAMKKLTKAMCWEVVSITNDSVDGVGIAMYRKPNSNKCYEQRNVPLDACLHKVPVDSSESGSRWPEQWPARLDKTPYWLSSSLVGAYGKPAPEDFAADSKHWKRVVTSSYQKELGINWSTVRNVMDMRAVYGGFAATLKEFNLWVMNVVSIDAPDTLPIIYERGLFGIYHDWCESFSTYPRSYDLLHADHLFSKIKKKCNFMALVSEADRILRPQGTIIVRDTAETITELESLFKSLQWEILVSYSNNKEGLLCAQKSMWRPNEEETVEFAIA